MGRHFTFTGGTLARATLACSVLLAAPLCAEDTANQTPPAPAPTRHEVWVPTKHLKEVLKKHPNAVVLDRMQYEALIRDAGRVGPLKDQEAPISAVIEEVKVTARVPAGMTMATITYEFRIRNLREGWSAITVPFALGGIAGGTALPSSPASSTLRDVMLTDMSAEKPIMVTADENAWKTTVLSQGSGRHVLRLVFAAPVSAKDGTLGIYGPGLTEVIWKEGTKGKQPAGPVPSVPVRLELPEGWRPSSTNPATQLDDGAWLVSSGTQFWSAPARNAAQPFPMVKVEWEAVAGVAKGDDSVIQSQGSTLYSVSGDRVAVIAMLGWSGTQPRATETLRVALPKNAQVLRASTLGPAMDATAWKPVDGGVEFQSPVVAKSSGKVLVEFEAPWGVASGAVQPLELPVARVEGAVTTRWDLAILAEPDIGVRLAKLLPTARPVTELDKQTLRSLAQGATKGVGVGAQLQAESQRDLFAHPRFLGAFSFDTPPDQAVVEVQAVPDRFSVDADALVEVTSHEVGVLRTLVFHGEAGSTSRAVITLPDTEVFLEVPVTSGEQVLWKQVGRDIEVTWPKGLAKGGQTSMTVRTRRDIPPQAADGTAAEKMVIASIPVSGASRVSGYAALKFDESWKVNVTDVTGLETRDARATPVRGRMAWFGLKEWKLGFDLSRRAPVHDATVTAYALPRAKQVEIEGQIALSVSGAPLRKFQVKLPVAIAPLLRVTSPLVGEQSLDTAAGVWTLSLGRELIGTANVRFRMSLPADSAAEGSREGTLTAALPDITLPGARRTAGRWVVEANTDTELAFTTRGVQPLDSRRPPVVEGYAPQHRIIAAYSHGGGEHEIRLTATRHDAASLAGMVLIHLRMTSVLGQDGSARHEAIFTLRHNGRQFATIRLPDGVDLLSTMVDGKVVKPVKAGANEVRLPLSSRIGDSAPIEVKVIYDTPSGAWGGSGKVALTPPTLGDEVPVMETQWKVYSPDGFTLAHDGSGLEEDEKVDSARPRGLWKSLFGGFSFANEREWKSQMDFLPGGVPAAATVQQQEDIRSIVERLNRIVLREVKFQGAGLEDALEYLRIKAGQAGASGGVNMIVKPGTSPTSATISLDLKDVPFLEALRYVTELSGTKYQINPSPGPGMPGAIVIVPMADATTDLHVQQFKLPLAQMLALKERTPSGGAVPGTADPFATGREVTASDMDILKAQGIAFPQGSMVRYDRDSQTLVISNTKPNLDLVDRLVSSLKPEDDFADPMVNLNEPAVGFGKVHGGMDYNLEKMSKLIFPKVQFNNTSIEEAIEFLRIKSRDVDHMERDPSKKGVNLIIKPGAAPSTATISLDLTDVPMSEALRYVTELGGMKYKVEPFAVVVVPITDVATEMYTRTFRAPPSLWSSAEGSGLSSRATAKEQLASMGIPFPEGSSAVFLPATSQLIVRNTQPSLDLIESYTDGLMVVAATERRNASLARAKSGQVPLELELPMAGQVLSLAGQQRPKELTLRYLSWERQMARTSLLVLLGIAVFWTLGRDRVWLTTFVAVLLLTCVPVLLLPSWSLTCHALLTGWLLALGVWLLWKVACWWKRRTEVTANANGGEVVA
ncbi:hypothetical protein DES53_101215 [Roseimicrobium gellanilyticum]|uniref:Multidrug efflux pump subunit AcrB n=1 Tax=Roseimicrobium gellanilyticum TaxID=748857 RepID=A0A366HVV1_9BACT|nr:hypothetical protein [Roseimicrobium gellanilyticum]RBP47418.1 hypothetical protein DES53_101215 [Roseimicrobium gellanilyticum]